MAERGEDGAAGGEGINCPAHEGRVRGMGCGAEQITNEQIGAIATENVSKGNGEVAGEGQPRDHQEW